MAYKLICIDLDGTLLNSRKQVSGWTRTVLQQAQERGVQLAISTGRTYADASCYAERLGLQAAIIASNGAYVKPNDTVQPLCESPIGAGLMLRIVEICRKYRVKPCFHALEHEFYSSVSLGLLARFFACKNGFRQTANIRHRYLGGYWGWGNLDVRERNRIVKCVIIDFNAVKMQKLRNEFTRIEALEVVSSWPNNLELNRKGVSKGKGVELLTDFYNLKKEEVIAIGDSENDLSMIRFAGLGVAMGNAAGAIKEQADYVADTNENDGVAKVIEKFVLQL